MHDDLPFEDTPPISEPAQSGEPDHTQTDDDSEAQPSWNTIDTSDNSEMEAGGGAPRQSRPEAAGRAGNGHRSVKQRGAA